MPRAQGEAPVLVTSAAARPFVRGIVERFRSQTPVLSQAEIHPRARLKTIAGTDRDLPYSAGWPANRAFSSPGRSPTGVKKISRLATMMVPTRK